MERQLVTMKECTWLVPTNTTASTWEPCRLEIAHSILAHFGSAVNPLEPTH